MADEKISRVHVERVTNEGGFFYQASIGGVSAYGESVHESLMRLGAVLYGRLEESRLMVKSLDSIVAPLLEETPVEQWPKQEAKEESSVIFYQVCYQDEKIQEQWNFQSQCRTWDQARLRYRQCIEEHPERHWRLLVIANGIERVVKDSAAEPEQVINEPHPKMLKVMALNPPDTLRTLVDQWGEQSIYDAFMSRFGDQVTTWPQETDAPPLVAPGAPERRYGHYAVRRYDGTHASGDRMWTAITFHGSLDAAIEARDRLKQETTNAYEIFREVLSPDGNRLAWEEVPTPKDRCWWVSWSHYPDDGGFEMTWPWWISGSRIDRSADTIVAAVRAPTENAAWDIIQTSYDTVPEDIDRRFIEERRDDWEPFTDRFPKADWMVW